MSTKSHSIRDWFLIYTKPNQEYRAKENLQNQGHTVFLPMIGYENVKEPSSLSLKPMFPRYLFFKPSLGSENWNSIGSTKGVSHVITFGNNFAKIPDTVMKFLMSRVDNNDIATINNKKRAFKKGEDVSIKQGVFKGMNAKFLSLNGKERVRVLLNIMNQELISELPVRNIEGKVNIGTFKL